ncbi:hypothetical protein EV188_10546 [Actinomycetospora succinea]|uniref:MEDS domain-containing protein n=1 Tax=Actinomycetospora succinea TaxID=663603 RepID=A0A4V3D9C5_9PSEU|nr:MEDS domain-containing protein [Actinomycetospora succinea]TDQ55650.1 hypothetical protein EV188_10546 [Actinomycetospora succinea]
MTGGLVHLGLVFDGPEDLAASAAPTLRRALDGGDEVVVAADRGTVRNLREALGPDAERIAFPPPASLVRPSEPDFLTTVRRWARPDRRTTVLGQYLPTMSARACGFGEDALGVVLGDLPLTLICCCRRDLDPELLAALRRTHPQLATAIGVTANPDYRAPATTSPTPAALWGAVAGRVGVHGLADLGRLRRCVAEVAARAGLEGDAVRAAVLAVHEAAVHAVRRGEPDHAHLTLEVRALPGQTLFSELTGPHGIPVQQGPSGDPLAHLRPFCARAVVHEEPERRAVRVLSSV